MICFLYDADLILEALLNRDKFIEDAENIWSFIQSRPNKSYICEIGLEKIKNFICKLYNEQAAEEIFCEIKNNMLVCRLNPKLSPSIRSSNIKDIDSAVEIACSNNYNISAIITNNPQKYAGSNLPILSIDGLSKYKLFKEIQDFEVKLYNSSISWNNNLLKDQFLNKIQNKQDIQYLENLFKKPSFKRFFNQLMSSGTNYRFKNGNSITLVIDQEYIDLLNESSNAD